MKAKLQLTFDIKPKAVQSFRFTKAGIRYQPKEIKDWKNSIRLQAKNQIGRGFNLLTDEVKIKVDFVFKLPKKYPQYKYNAIAGGEIHYKTTKPDLTDNLMKGFIDSLSGIIWEADQQICEVESRKIYGVQSSIRLEVFDISPETAEAQDLFQEPEIDLSF